MTPAYDAFHDITPRCPGYSGPALSLMWHAGDAVVHADDPRVPDPWVLVPVGLLERLAAASADEEAAREARALAGAAGEARALLGIDLEQSQTTAPDWRAP